MNYNFVLVEMLCDLHTGQHAYAHTTYVSSLRGERDLFDLHARHASEGDVQLCIVVTPM